MKALSKLWLLVMKLTEYVLVIQLGLLCLVLLYQVISRYVFNSPLVWSEELAIYLMTWVTFMGISYAVHKRTHVRMTSIEAMFPASIRKLLVVSMDVVCIVACAAAVLPSLEYFTTMSRSYSPGMRLNYGFVYACMPVGFTLAVLSLAADIGRVLKGDLPPI